MAYYSQWNPKQNEGEVRVEDKEKEFDSVAR